MAKNNTAARRQTAEAKAKKLPRQKGAPRKKERDMSEEEAKQALADAGAEIQASGEAPEGAPGEKKIEPHASKNKTTKAGLREIAVRKAWNMRSVFGAVGEDEEEIPEDGSVMGGFDPETGLPVGGLIGGIYLKGQNTPVDVRPNTKAGGKEPYELVTGERRIRAMTALNEKGFTWPGGGTVENPVVRVTLWEELSDEDADDLNGIENVNRENCPSCDVAFQVARMAKNGGGRTDTAVAEMLGLRQSYVSKLHRIMKEVNPKITRAWRASGLDISYKELEPLTKLARSEQDDAWAAILKRHPRSGEKGEGDGATSETKWVETASAKAADFARALGVFSAYGYTKIDDVLGIMSEDGWLEVVVKVKKDATKNQRKKIVRAATDAFVTSKNQAIENAKAGDEDTEKAVA